MRQAYRVAGSVAGAHFAARARCWWPTPSARLMRRARFSRCSAWRCQRTRRSLDVDNRLFPRVRDPGASQVIKDALLIFPERPAVQQSATDHARAERFAVRDAGVSALHARGRRRSSSCTCSSMRRAAAIGTASRSTPCRSPRGASTSTSTGGRWSGRRLHDRLHHRPGVVPQSERPVRQRDRHGDGVVRGTRPLRAWRRHDRRAHGDWNSGRQKSYQLSGLYQSEATGYTRPQIGYEPRASLLAGVTGDFLFEHAVAHRLHQSPGRRSRAPRRHRFRLTGELAVSRPDPNRSGDAYLEEFEDDHSIQLLAAENRWVPGSMPQSAVGLSNIMPRRASTAPTRCS